MSVATSNSAQERAGYWVKNKDVAPFNPGICDLLEGYSKIPAEKIREHVLNIREQAWQVFPFPCIGQLRFLEFSLCEMRAYQELLERLQRKDDRPVVIDVGCCFGQDLRKLVRDGADGSTLIGIELRGEFNELGLDLFRDRDTFPGRLISVDVFDESPDGPVRELERRADVVHAASFLHLFERAAQVTAVVHLMRLLRARNGSLVLGRQAGARQARTIPHPTNPSGFAYLHNAETFCAMWEEAGKLDGSDWDLEIYMQDASSNSTTDASPSEKSDMQWIYFEARRV